MEGIAMKLIIFGSTGGTGRQLVTQALELGHTVCAFARHPEKLTQELGHQQLQVIEGDVQDTTSVEEAIKGQDAVLCALGAPASNKSLIRTKGTKNIIHAMQQSGVKRFVCQSGFGAGDSHALLPFYYKYLIFPLMLRHAYEDHELQEKLIKDSSLDWVIVRPGSMTDGEHTGSYRHGFTASDPASKIKISRADVADFMLKQVMNNHYLHQTPAVSY
jgi:putative NADH-flavin reductase